MKPRILSAALLLRAIAVAGAIGLASSTSDALARVGQGGTGAGGAAASKAAAVPGVVVQPPSKGARIPPARKAALDTAAAKRKAWNTYRTTTPAPTPASIPAAGVGAPTRAENYPGLHASAH